MAMAAANEPIWRAEGAEKRRAVQEMFGEIAPTYDLLNSFLSLRLHRSWRRTVAAMLDLKDGNLALDVCSGTGDFLPELRKLVGDRGTVLGVDFSPEMLKRAAAKYDESLSLGDACQLPVQGGCIDGVTVGWGLRNVPDVDRALTEIFRVLKSGGRFVSIDMAQPKSALSRKVSSTMFNTIAPKLGAIVGKTDAYTYLPKSTARFMSRENLMASMQKAGFTEVKTKDLCFGNICIHFGRKP